MPEADPFGEPPFYELLSEDQKEVCRQLHTYVFDLFFYLSDAWYAMPRDAPAEIDALLGVAGFDSYCRTKEEEISSLPTLGFYEADFSVSSALKHIGERLPFSDRELELLHQTVPKWNEERGDWYEYPGEDERELIARWQGWLFKTEMTESRAVASEDAKGIADLFSKLHNSLEALLPREQE